MPLTEEQIVDAFNAARAGNFSTIIAMSPVEIELLATSKDDSDRTILHYVAFHADKNHAPELAELLLQCEPDLTARDGFGQTAWSYVQKRFGHKLEPVPNVEKALKTEVFY